MRLRSSLCVKALKIQWVQALTYCLFLQCLQLIALVNLNDCRFQARNMTPWLNRKQIEGFPQQML